MTNTKPRGRINQHGVITDGFANFMSGLGAGNPKTAAHTYVMNYDQTMLEAAYRTSTWFGKIVDIPADDATREWRMWKADKADIELLEKEEKRLQVRQKVRQALIWARLYGGAVIVPIGLPGTHDQPLLVENVRKGGVKALTVLSRHEINAQGMITDPLNPLYGQPESYQINSTGGAPIDIHPSRVIRFNGREVNSRNTGQNGWGDSVWMHLRDAVTAADGGAAVIDALLQEAKIDVIRIPDMMSGMATPEYEAIMLKRWQMVAMLKSISNVLLLDGADEWSQKQLSFTGLPEVANTLLNIMAGAADIPVSRLTGKQEAGLSGSDQGSLRNYYDSVKSKQELVIGPAMSPLDEMVIRSALGTRDDSVWYDWKPLLQMSDKEKAEIDKLEAEATTIYVNTGLIPSDAMAKAVQNRMIESGRWPGIEDALSETDLDLPPIDEDDTLTEAERKATNDAAPRTLYVRRDVLNADEIIEWAKGQGFTDIVPDLHITIAFSRQPVDWMKMGEAWQSKIEIDAGGPRLMEKLGPSGEYTALLIKFTELEWRNQHMREHGASWDWPDYQPHISIQVGGDVDLEKIEPYQGKIVLGPEIFEEVREG